MHCLWLLMCTCKCCLGLFSFVSTTSDTSNIFQFNCCASINFDLAAVGPTKYESIYTFFFISLNRLLGLLMFTIIESFQTHTFVISYILW